MTSKAACTVALCLFQFVAGVIDAAAQRVVAPPPDRSPAETVAPAIPGVVAGGTKVQLIKEGFVGTEGPIAAPDGSLLFGEHRGGNRIIKIDSDGRISVYRENSNDASGLAFDSKGRLIAVERTTALVAIIEPTRTVLADRFEGEPFRRPNDLVVDRKDGVYFTDDGNPPEGQPPKPGVFYITPAGRLIKLDDEIQGSNGIMLSPDERVLYIAGRSEFIVAFDVLPDGRVTNKRNFARLQGDRHGADGLAVDAMGRLYVSSGGVQVFSSQGQHLGTIPIPRGTQNVAFAGPGKRTLYVVGNGAVYQIAMLAEGFKGRAK